MLTHIVLLATLAAGTIAQQEISCFCREQASKKVRVDWTTSACHDQGYMRGDACIIVSDPVRNNDFQNDCLEIDGLQTAECGP
ncbi:hypothetical protein CPAR01_09443 [Colletotrichum paranaense]|uniref:Uncharacterized protein n=1 Tax=Colletotrichum paranaense TaxID=1914294 RepID=A0ABQ9SGQ9_9PEZI|nr:uncharacterized protein CPAR01_09443 [Colletotrichum paranaense]KAK1535901.1 hypothetical protein CPAR01_09443 [Colletotrichum paranaense]